MSRGAQTLPRRGASKPSHWEELIVSRRPPSTNVPLKEARHGESVEGGCGARNRSGFGTGVTGRPLGCGRPVNAFQCFLVWIQA